MKGFILSSIGGVIIGLAASMMLIFNGRVTGISGIFNGVMTQKGFERLWRMAFVLGLISGGVVMNLLKPELFTNTLDTSNFRLTVAGLLVGVGTVMGSGCTSGHGVCGLSRLSIRSVWATLTFMISGILTVTLLRIFGV